MPALLVTPEDLGAWVGLNPPGAVDKALLEKLEAAAVRFLERETGLVLAQPETDLTHYYCASGRNRLFLDTPARAITSLAYRGGILDSWTAYAASDYEFFGREVFFGVAPQETSFPSLKVVFTPDAYAAPNDQGVSSAPLELQQHIRALVGGWFRGRPRAVTDEASSQRVTLADVPDSVKRWIQANRSGGQARR